MDTTPLLEEERDFLAAAGLENPFYPFLFHSPGAMTAFSANDGSPPWTQPRPASSLLHSPPDTLWAGLRRRGSLYFSKFDAPAFDLLIRGEKVRFNAGPLWAGSANLALTVVGTREAANISGGAEIIALETTPRPDFGALISSGNPETIRVPAPEISLKHPSTTGPTK